MKKLQLVTKDVFNGIQCDFYKDCKNDIVMTREQIGQALEYTDPGVAIGKIHDRHKERLDNLSTFTKLVKVEGDRRVERDTYLYNAKGVYEICRWSHKPKADAFMDWVWDIIEGLRTGLLKLSIERQTAEWQEARQSGKKSRLAETDEIKLFAQYCEERGSKSANRYYKNLTSLVNGAVGLDSRQRDIASSETLQTIGVLENVIRRTLSEEMAKNTEYHQIYRICKKKVVGLMQFVNLPDLARLA